MNSFTFLIKVAYQDESRSKRALLGGLRTELREATKALKDFDRESEKMANKFASSLENIGDEMTKLLKSKGAKTPTGLDFHASNMYKRMATKQASMALDWVNHSKARADGRVDLASTADGAASSVGNLTDRLQSLADTIFKLGAGSAIVDTTIKIGTLSLTLMAISKSIQLFGTEAMGVARLFGLKLVMPLMEAHAELQQKLIPLHSLTGQSNSSILESIQRLANLPALDFRSSAQAMLDLVVSDPKRDMLGAERMLKAIANAVFSSGGGPERVDLVTLALKQMRAKGIVAGEEVTKQLSPNIPGIFQFMKESFGTADTRELKTRGVTPDDFIEKLIPWLEKTYPKLPDSPQTMIENLIDRLFYSKAEIGGGIWKVAKDGMQAIVDTIDALIKSGALKELGISLAKLLELDNVKSMSNTVISIVAGINTLIKTLDKWKDALITWVINLANWGSVLLSNPLTAPLAGFFNDLRDNFQVEFDKLRKSIGNGIGGANTKSGVQNLDVDAQIERLKDQKRQIVDSYKSGAPGGPPKPSAFGPMNPFYIKDLLDWFMGMGKQAKKLEHGQSRIADINKQIAELEAKKKNGKTDVWGLAQTLRDAMNATNSGGSGGQAFFSSSKWYDAREKMDEFKVKADEIIMGGNNARRYISPLDYMGKGGAQKPAIQVQVHGVSALHTAVGDMIYDIATQLVRQGAIQGAS